MRYGSRQTAPAAPRKNVPLAEKTQAELVDYSIKSDDIAGAGEDYEAKSQLNAFKEYLKICPGPDGYVEVKRYLAKGTNGYVFEGSLIQEGGKKTALKLIRMTQAGTGMKEWYVSKLLRANEIPNCVLADENVIVMPKEGSPSSETPLASHCAKATTTKNLHLSAFLNLGIFALAWLCPSVPASASAATLMRC